MVNKLSNIFSETFVADDKKKTIRAPVKKYFAISSIFFSSDTATSGYMIVTGEPLEDLDYIPDNSKAICSFSCNQKLSQNAFFPDPIICKFITVGFNTSGAFNARISIHYKLVNASKANLIYDFVKRYR